MTPYFRHINEVADFMVTDRQTVVQTDEQTEPTTTAHALMVKNSYLLQGLVANVKDIIVLVNV
jgi:hypothetical protein